MRHRAVKPSELTPATDEEKRLGAVIDTITHPESGITIRIRLNKSTSTFGALVGGESLKDMDGQKLRERVLKAIARNLKVDWIPVIEIKAIDPRSRYYTKLPTDKISGEIEVGAKIEASRFYIVHVDGAGKWRSLDWHLMKSSKDISAKMSASQRWDAPVDEDELDLSSISLHDHAARSRARMQHQFEKKKTFSLPYYGKFDKSVDAYGSNSSVQHYLPYDENLWQALIAIGGALVTAQNQINTLIGSPKGVTALSAVGANIPKLLGAGDSK